MEMLGMKKRSTVSRVEAFVEKIFEPDMHAKRVMSLARATAGAVQTASLAIHAIGRAMALAYGLDAKHAIKQVDRLLSNDGIDPDVFFPSWVRSCIGPRKDIVVALDWTEFDRDDHSTIALHLVTSTGRALPLFWKTVVKSELKGWRNEHEDDLLLRFEAALPDAVSVTLLADRGFGDQKLYELLSSLAFDYVIRFRGIIRVEHGAESKAASDWVLPTGRARILKDARVTADRYQVGSVVCVHDRKMKEPWFLATSFRDRPASQLVKLYGRRFTIEESFRDIKDLRFGLGLSSVQIRSPERRDRMLLITAIASVLLTLLGAAGESIGLDRRLKANTAKTRTHSLFFQGCHYYLAIPAMRRELLEPLVLAFDKLLRADPALALVFESGK
jgi:hypothetical protein